MLDPKLIKDNVDFLKDLLIKRNMDPSIADDINAVDIERREVMKKVEELRSLKNKVSKEIAAAKKNKLDANDLLEKSKEISLEQKELESKLNNLTEKYNFLYYKLPNVLEKDVPVGKDENDNVEVRKVGEPRKFDFEPKAHWDIDPEQKWIDFDRGVKLSGSRFTVLKSDIARLERSLINFMLDLHTKKHGYTEVMPPHLVSEKTATATGHLPVHRDELFLCERDELVLIPTAEMALVGLMRDEIISEDQLPLKYVAYTPCYRREAGSYGKDIRGIIRQHQFDKVELVKFTKPEDSEKELHKLLNDAEEVLKILELPYRVIELCSGDIGVNAARTYDIEVWLPSYNAYKEISSCSNMWDFQARRGKIRYRDKNTGKTKLVHTLNGSGLAVGRTLVALLENYQQKDGSILVPKALVKYFGKEKVG